MWREAIDEGKRSVRLDPSSVEAYNAVGFAALQLGEGGLAVTYLSAATEAGEVPAFMYNNLGQALERVDRPWEALEAYRTALLMDPGHRPSRWHTERLRQKLDAEEADAVATRLAGASGEIVATDAPMPEDEMEGDCDHHEDEDHSLLASGPEAESAPAEGEQEGS